MNQKNALNDQIIRFGFWSAIIAMLTLIAPLFISLDVPAGYTAEHADRVVWLNANRGTFIIGWINQIAAMLSLSDIFLAMCWKIAIKNPLRAILAAMVVLISVVAFIIPKFMAVWAIPLLADTISTGAVGAQLADPLLRLLNVSIPFSLYTSFDYLGFWLYAVFGLLVAIPLYGENLSTKTAALAAGLFGLIYHALLIALLMGAIVAVNIEPWFLSASGLLIILIVAMVFSFRSAIKSQQPSPTR